MQSFRQEAVDYKAEKHKCAAPEPRLPRRLCSPRFDGDINKMASESSKEAKNSSFSAMCIDDGVNRPGGGCRPETRICSRPLPFTFSFFLNPALGAVLVIVQTNCAARSYDNPMLLLDEL